MSDATATAAPPEYRMALRIQCAFRRWRARATTKELKAARKAAFDAEVQQSLLESAAITLQAAQRRHAAMKKANQRKRPATAVKAGGSHTSPITAPPTTETTHKTTAGAGGGGGGVVTSPNSNIRRETSIGSLTSTNDGVGPTGGASSTRRSPHDRISPGSNNSSKCVLVLLSGQVPSEQAKAEADAIIFLQENGSAAGFEDESISGFYVHPDSSLTRAFALQSLILSPQQRNQLIGVSSASFSRRLNADPGGVMSSSSSTPPMTAAGAGGHAAPPRLDATQTMPKGAPNVSGGGGGATVSAPPGGGAGVMIRGTLLMECASIVIQSWWRRAATRSRFKLLLKKHKERFQEECEASWLTIHARAIQSAFRGHRERKKLSGAGGGASNNNGGVAKTTRSKSIDNADIALKPTVITGGGSTTPTSTALPLSLGGGGPAAPSTGALAPSTFAKRKRLELARGGAGGEEHLPTFGGTGKGLSALFFAANGALMDKRSTMERSMLWGVRILHTVVMESLESHSGSSQTKQGGETGTLKYPELEFSRWVQGPLGSVIPSTRSAAGAPSGLSGFSLQQRRTIEPMGNSPQHTTAVGARPLPPDPSPRSHTSMSGPLKAPLPDVVVSKSPRADPALAPPTFQGGAAGKSPRLRDLPPVVDRPRSVGKS